MRQPAWRFWQDFPRRGGVFGFGFGIRELAFANSSNGVCSFTYATAASQDVIISMIGSASASDSNAFSSASPAIMLVVTMFSLAAVRLAML